MRIGINGLFHASGGCLKNLRQLIDQWHRSGMTAQHDFVLFTSRQSWERLADVLPRGVEVQILPLADRGPVGRLIAEQWQLPSRVARSRIDVLFCPANTMPLATKVPCVVTFQNAVPFAPEMRQCPTRWRERVRWWALRHLIRATARRARRIIFISQYFRELLAREYGLDAHKGTVIYRARERQETVKQDRSIEAKYGLRRPYLLMVSHLYPYKNILELIEGYVLARKRGALANMQLAIAGGALLAPRYHAQIKSLLAKLGLTDHQVVLTGDVPQAEVQRLLAGCAAFVFPSVCENCPTALIEALSMGRPVACSNIGVMPEIAGDAALYFDPFDPASIADALVRMMEEPGLAQALADRSRAQANLFPDDAEMARQTLQAIESALDASTVRVPGNSIQFLSQRSPVNAEHVGSGGAILRSAVEHGFE